MNALDRQLLPAFLYLAAVLFVGLVSRLCSIAPM